MSSRIDGKTIYAHCAISKAFGRLIAKRETLDNLKSAIQAAKERRTITGKGKEVFDGATYYAV